MVKFFFSLLRREFFGVHEAAYVLATFTLFSQLLALLRDRALAHTFGAGHALDAYFAAFRIPDLLFAVLMLFVSTLAIVPLLARKSKEEQGELIGNVLVAFSVVAASVSVVVAVLMPTLVRYLYPGFDESLQQQVVAISRLMLVQPILLGLSSVASAVVQTSRQFILFALAPIMYNVGILFGIFVLVPQFGIMGLAWGVVLGALLHALVQVTPLLFHGWVPLHVRFASITATVRDVVMPSLPRSLALISSQFLFLVFAGLASALSAGALSAISFAYNLQSVPYTVIAVSYAAALFPTLASLAARAQLKLFSGEVWVTVRHVCFWLFPATVLLVVLRAQIVRVILGSGQFTWDDTRITAAVVALFAVSLAAQSVVLIFSRAYYAVGVMRVPVFLNIAGAVVAALLAWVGLTWIGEFPRALSTLEMLFRVSGVEGTEVLIIPLAYSLSMIFIALVFALHFAIHYGIPFGTIRSLACSFASSLIGGMVAYSVLNVSAPLLPTTTLVGIFSQGAFAGLLGLAAMGAMLALMRSEELSDLIRVLKSRYARYIK